MNAPMRPFYGILNSPNPSPFREYPGFVTGKTDQEDMSFVHEFRITCGYASDGFGHMVW
jgi:hypothetical protein